MKPLFMVIPDFDSGGADWQMFARADTPEEALRFVWTEVPEREDIKIKSIEPYTGPLESGDKSWAVFAIPEGLTESGVMPWSDIKRTDYTVTAAEYDGTEGQDRESYSDTQDRSNYS